MAKAFEGLFSSVTCLPGCFTLFSPSYKKLSNQIVHDYSQICVDNLHIKNLLHLGKEHYLTTLLLKHFAMYKTQFIRHARAETVAADNWKVLLSQHHHWINLTVHNLGELMFLDQLCGFYCFSMHFIVMVDLVSMLFQPVTVAYIVYLMVSSVYKHSTVLFISLIMIATVYGLQALVFILCHKWMVFYILGIPIFSFMLPIYSFWCMDDFSWSAMHLVLGESGKKIIVHDEGKFDAHSIYLMTWNDYSSRNTPLSMAMSHMHSMNIPVLPCDVDLEHAIQNVFQTADLNTITMHEIRHQLEEQFGMNLTACKVTINAAINWILLENQS
ncbi:hypothetical protein PISMIDRAFT_29839 [Pisolithus microcarpus 441]|uniref:Unplaced genomic scaffold scaffold_64, whole genome shotgun sequence n=1 Tax=Pisolithus microcarpus 441 TaxID=765257 RepID=A0A0C9YAG3_9AGAM|nr:chitin synthase [Pisolithus microcarpus]KIK21735.1 hypothetical protein PISMIDRAFT_29839 [Pisolithus microcarpus 441]